MWWWISAVSNPEFVATDSGKLMSSTPADWVERPIEMEVKMRRKLLCLIFLVMALICYVSTANAAGMDSKYLVGNWVIGTAEQECGDSGSEYFIFRENGAFEAGRSAKAEAVGFWKIDGDILYLDFISSGGFFQDIHTELKEFEGVLDYFQVKLVPFNVEENRFEAVGVLGDQINRGIAVRCR